MSSDFSAEIKKLSPYGIALLRGSVGGELSGLAAGGPRLGGPGKSTQANIQDTSRLIESQLRFHKWLSVGLIVASISAAAALIYFAFAQPSAAGTAVTGVTTLLTGGITLRVYQTYTKWANQYQTINTLQTKLQRALSACEQKSDSEIDPCKSDVIDIFNRQLFSSPKP
jgi:hypothetical protein